MLSMQSRGIEPEDNEHLQTQLLKHAELADAYECFRTDHDKLEKESQEQKIVVVSLQDELSDLRGSLEARASGQDDLIVSMSKDNGHI